MKISHIELRHIIRKTLLESFGPSADDWYEFKKMALAGNNIGCARWIENVLDKMNGTTRQNRNTKKLSYILELEDVYMLIDYAKNKNVAEADLQKEFDVLLGARK